MSFSEVAQFLSGQFGSTFYVVPNAKIGPKLLVTDSRAIPIQARFVIKLPKSIEEANSDSIYGGGTRGPSAKDRYLFIADKDYSAITIDDRIIEQNGDNYKILEIWQERVGNEVVYRYLLCRPSETLNTRG